MPSLPFLFDSRLIPMIRLYKDLPFFEKLFLYARSCRLLRAPYIEIADLVPKKGRIIDLGCGYGFFPNFLAYESKDREIIGVEKSDKRLTFADRSMSNVTFDQADLIHYEFQGTFDAMISIFVLHHFPSFQSQENLLRKCFAHLNPGGTLLIGEIAEKPLWKHWGSYLVDKCLYFNDYLHYRSQPDWLRLFDSIGFKSVHLLDVSRGIPFAHVVYRCCK